MLAGAALPAPAGAQDACPDASYRVYDVPEQGRFCIEPKRNDFIKNRLRRGEVWEPYIVEQIRAHARPGSVAIDAGAHIGAHTIPMARAVGRGGRVHAFEPQRKLHRELVANLRLNGIENTTAHALALGNAAGAVEMNPTTPRNEGGTGFGRGGERVEMRTLDSFGLEGVSLIKIDVEHAEGMVLEGARATIGASRPVLLLEIMGGFAYESAPPSVRARIEATLDRIIGLGYQVRRLAPYDYLALPERRE